MTHDTMRSEWCSAAVSPDTRSPGRPLPTLLRAVEAELLLLIASRSSRWVLPGIAALAGLLTATLLLTATGPEPALDPTTIAGLSEAVLDPLTGLLLLPVAAAASAAAMRGSGVWAHLADPNPMRRTGALLIAIAIYAALGAGLAALAKVLAVVVSQAAGGPAWTWGHPLQWQFHGGAVLYAVLMSLIGAALGVASRSASGVCGAVLAWIVVVEGLLGSILPDNVARWLPHGALAQVRNLSGALDWTTALAVGAGVTAGCVAVALLTASRRDVA